MKETGLMFKAPLVRSILDGTKTQTRRVVKPQPVIEPSGIAKWEGPANRMWCGGADIGNSLLRSFCPYGQPGDRIYVRETHAQVLGPDIPTGRPRGPKGTSGIPARPEWQSHYVYLADGEMPPVQWHHLGDSQPVRWTPSILMPKHAARIWLDITGVRLERLQDISEADCIAEGISELPHQAAERGCWWTGNVAGGAALHGRTPRNAFQLLWESTGGDWAANPWCWVIDFRRGTAQKGRS